MNRLESPLARWDTREGNEDDRRRNYRKPEIDWERVYAGLL
ncbi:MAG: hypothetical protein ACRDTN_08100 [Mycobacterium sp.]